MTNVANPISFKPSSGFEEFKIFDFEGYLVAEWKSGTVGQITNKKTAEFLDYSLFQSSLKIAEPNQYTLQVTPSSVMPSSTVIVIDYPPGIEMSGGVTTSCIVTTNKVFSENCSFDLGKR